MYASVNALSYLLIEGTFIQSHGVAPVSYVLDQSNQKLVPWGTDGRLPLSDLDLDSGHTAYRRASLIGPLPTYQISLRSEENFFLKVTTEVLVKFRVT